MMSFRPPPSAVARLQANSLLHRASSPDHGSDGWLGGSTRVVRLGKRAVEGLVSSTEDPKQFLV
jgi:hypothetical protein